MSVVGRRCLGRRHHQSLVAVLVATLADERDRFLVGGLAASSTTAATLTERT